MIYFIRSTDGTVKVGRASDVGERLRSLQIGNPNRLRIARTIPGNRMTEKWLHRRFRSLRIRGEWFRWAPEMQTIEPPHLVDDRPVASQRMSELRAEHGATQSECAEALGVAQSTYAGMESGAGRYRRRDLITLAMMYGVEPSEAFPDALDGSEVA